MAELNFGLLTPPGSQSIGNAFAQGMDQAAVARAQENQNALSQYTLSKAKREDEVNNRLLSDLRAAKTPEEQMQAYVYAGRAKDALAMQSDILKIAETKGKILAQPGDREKTELGNKAAKATFFATRLPTLAQSPDDAGVGRFLKEAVDAGVMSFEEASAKSADLLSKSLPERRLQMLQGGQNARDALAALKPKFEEFSGGLYNVNEIDPNTGMPRFLSQRFAPPSTDAAIRSANAAGMKWNPETLQFENVGGALAQPGFAPAQGTPGAAPAPAGAPRTPAAFPRITPQVQNERNIQQIALLNAELLQPVNSNPADQQRIRAEIAKLSTGDPFAKAGANPLPVVNNTPGAAAAAAAPVVNALVERSPKDQRDAKVVASTTTDSAGNVRRFNKFGEQIGEVNKGAGKPSATYERTQALQKQLTQDLALTIRELENAVKPKGLIEQSTGSGAGALVDASRAFFGGATEGAIAVATLKPIYDRVLKIVPRFEGPQSNKDTQSYENAAGQLANPAVPNEIKLAAAKEILRIMKERQAQFISRDMVELPNEPAGASSSAQPASGFLVTAPNKNVYKFTTQAEADAFKKSAGIP
jgi:hypothetical protein